MKNVHKMGMQKTRDRLVYKPFHIKNISWILSILILVCLNQSCADY